MAKGEEKTCLYAIETKAGKKNIIVKCSDCIGNASFGNKDCRARLLKIFSHPDAGSGVDQLQMIKSFKRIYTGKELRKITDLAGVISGVESIALCRQCMEKLPDIWEDPLGHFYKLHDLKCKECKSATAKRRKALMSSKFVSSAVAMADSEKAYSSLITPIVVPNIVTAIISVARPKEAPLDKYSIENVRVDIYQLPDRPDKLYFLDYPEMALSNDELKVMEKAFREMSKVRENVNYDPQNIRKEFARIATEVVNKVIDKEEVPNRRKLIDIIVRHTAGYGVLEPLLADHRLQDIFIDSDSSVVHLIHSKWGECLTNITMTPDELEKISTRLRASSGRPLDASTPVLHAELEDFGIRVCGICEPSTYHGTGFAFRRRKAEPWTLIEFMQAGMLDAKTAGLLSFLIDGQSSLLITGPRSSGKTSLMTAMLLEIPQHTRVIIIEDTPEVPVSAMQQLGFKVEHLKTEAFAKGFEISAEDALRTSLRLGESTLIIGEVRGPEAKSLFEAMRVGAAGNVVLGTIHGSSPYDTWDRVVNDLGVPPTSFKALDIVVSTGSIRFGDDITRHRRVLSLTEVRKDWVADPKKAFVDLVSFQRRGGRWSMQLKKSETIRKIADVKGMTMNKAIESIKYRGKMKQALLNLSKKHPELARAQWVIAANNKFISLASGARSYKRVYDSWLKWVKSEVK